jgi:hypothetical protein
LHPERSEYEVNINFRLSTTPLDLFMYFLPD